jgi:hypothetical protein
MFDPSHLDRLAALDTNTVSDTRNFLELPGVTCGARAIKDDEGVVIVPADEA